MPDPPPPLPLRRASPAAAQADPAQQSLLPELDRIRAQVIEGEVDTLRLGAERVGFKVELLQEDLARTALVELASAAAARPLPAAERYRLFGHCTERTAAPASQTQWQQVFRAAGAELEVVQTGCCGMCGAYGHEAEHLADSRRAFELSWAKALARVGEGRRANDLVTGSSCRSQVKRFGGREPRHPVEVLAERLGAAQAPQLPASSPPAR